MLRREVGPVSMALFGLGVVLSLVLAGFMGFVGWFAIGWKPTEETIRTGQMYLLGAAVVLVVPWAAMWGWTRRPGWGAATGVVTVVATTLALVTSSIG